MCVISSSQWSVVGIDVGVVGIVGGVGGNAVRCCATGDAGKVFVHQHVVIFKRTGAAQYHANLQV
eukprot:5537641-Pleurochrysis_carterae.AAC.1